MNLKNILLFIVFCLQGPTVANPIEGWKESAGTENVPYYTVNLMWINRKLNEAQQYIYPAANEEKLFKNFLNHVFTWAAASRGGAVHLWFDSLLTPSAAVTNTTRLIDEYASNDPQLAPIVLRDVREFTYVKENPEVFSEKTPIFFRVDLLRAIAQVHDISEGITPYFVYGDLDMEPLSKEQLFDAETLGKLKKFGIVMAYCPVWQGFENGFQIVSYHNPYLIEAMKYALIELNIQRGYQALQNKFYKADHLPDIMPLVEKNLCNQRDEIVPQQPAIIQQNYSINIMWINERRKETQQYIHPGLHDDELQKNFFQPIFTWATANPDSVINLWFDGDVTTSRAVKNTDLFINAYVATHPNIARIVLRDIRELPYVKTYPEVFTCRTSHYFRSSVLQIIMALQDISAGRVMYFFYGDLFELLGYKDLFGLKSFSREELFDEGTIHSLQKFGVAITNKNGITKGVFGGNTTHIFELLKREWLDPNIEKAQRKLYGIDCCGPCCLDTMAGLQQIIWSSYPGMFKYFYHRAGFGKLTVEYFDHTVGQFISHDYDKEKDGLAPFGLDRRKKGGYFEASAQLPEVGVGEVWIPTKKVPLPRAELVYDDEAPVRKGPSDQS